jgi:hypothetical protein
LAVKVLGERHGRLIGRLCLILKRCLILKCTQRYVGSSPCPQSVDGGMIEPSPSSPSIKSTVLEVVDSPRWIGNL